MADKSPPPTAVSTVADCCAPPWLQLLNPDPTAEVAKYRKMTEGTAADYDLAVRLPSSRRAAEQLLCPALMLAVGETVILMTPTFYPY